MRKGTLAALLLCAACGAAPRPEAPPARERLAELEARAAVRAHAGDAAGAARAYEEALRIATSLEDADAIAAAAINLSLVYQSLGRNGDARHALSLVVDDARRPIPDRRRLEAELRRAMLDLASGDRAAAEAMAERAAARCAGGCDLSATILNVQAQAALARGDAAAAARRAQEALGQARSQGNRAEEGNALRTLGRAARLGGDPAAARRLVEQALAVDRALADPRKILADLTELSRAAAEAGDARAARDYAERASAVGRAAGESASNMAEMESQLRRP